MTEGPTLQLEKNVNPDCKPCEPVIQQKPYLGPICEYYDYDYCQPIDPVNNQTESILTVPIKLLKKTGKRSPRSSLKWIMILIAALIICYIIFATPYSITLELRWLIPKLFEKMASVFALWFPNKIAPNWFNQKEIHPPITHYTEVPKQIDIIWIFRWVHLISSMMAPKVVLPFLLLLLIKLQNVPLFGYIMKAVICKDTLCCMFLLSYITTGITQDTKTINNTKHQNKIINRTARKYLMTTLLMCSLIPEMLMGNDLKTSNDVKGFMNADGILRTRQLPNDLMKDIRGLIRSNILEDIVTNNSMSTAIIDSGCSMMCTPHGDDFKTNTLKPLKQKITMGGISGKLLVTHNGITDYTTIDTEGRLVSIQREGYLIPGLPTRLFPPQKLMNDLHDEWYKINNKRAELQFRNNQIVRTPYDQRSKLPYIFLFKKVDETLESINTSLYSCITKESNQNLNPAQNDALRYHWRLGHISVNVIRWLSQRGILGQQGNRIDKAVTNNDCPFCATCSYGKQTCNPSKKTSFSSDQKEHSLNINKLEPESMVCVDQFEISKPGRIFASAGLESNDKKLSGSTIFYDPSTYLLKCYFQVSLGGHETILSKNKFERFMNDNGRDVKHYRTDNGIFTKQKFMEEVLNKYQVLTSCGGEPVIKMVMQKEPSEL